MTHALHSVAIATAAGADTPYTVALAALNVLQTIALAYLAARAHLERRP